MFQRIRSYENTFYIHVVKFRQRKIKQKSIGLSLQNCFVILIAFLYNMELKYATSLLGVDGVIRVKICLIRDNMDHMRFVADFVFN